MQLETIRKLFADQAVWMTCDEKKRPVTLSPSGHPVTVNRANTRTWADNEYILDNLKAKAPGETFHRGVFLSRSTAARFPTAIWIVLDFDKAVTPDGTVTPFPLDLLNQIVPPELRAGRMYLQRSISGTGWHLFLQIPAESLHQLTGGLPDVPGSKSAWHLPSGHRIDVFGPDSNFVLMSMDAAEPVPESIVPLPAADVDELVSRLKSLGATRGSDAGPGPTRGTRTGPAAVPDAHGAHVLELLHKVTPELGLVHDPRDPTLVHCTRHGFCGREIGDGVSHTACSAWLPGHRNANGTTVTELAIVCKRTGDPRCQRQNGRAFVAALEAQDPTPVKEALATPLPPGFPSAAGKGDGGSATSYDLISVNRSVNPVHTEIVRMVKLVSTTTGFWPIARDLRNLPVYLNADWGCQTPMDRALSTAKLPVPTAESLNSWLCGAMEQGCAGLPIAVWQTSTTRTGASQTRIASNEQRLQFFSQVLATRTNEVQPLVAQISQLPCFPGGDLFQAFGPDLQWCAPIGGPMVVPGANKFVSRRARAMIPDLATGPVDRARALAARERLYELCFDQLAPMEETPDGYRNLKSRLLVAALGAVMTAVGGIQAPMTWLNSNNGASGKTSTAMTLGMLASGSVPAVVGVAHVDAGPGTSPGTRGAGALRRRRLDVAEIDKSVLSLLIDGRQSVILDNVNLDAMEDPSIGRFRFMSLLDKSRSGGSSFRILGTNTEVTLDHPVCLIGTGIQLRFDPNLLRRVRIIELGAPPPLTRTIPGMPLFLDRRDLFEEAIRCALTWFAGYVQDRERGLPDMVARMSDPTRPDHVPPSLTFERWGWAVRGCEIWSSGFDVDTIDDTGVSFADTQTDHIGPLLEAFRRRLIKAYLDVGATSQDLRFTSRTLSRGIDIPGLAGVAPDKWWSRHGEDLTIAIGQIGERLNAITVDELVEFVKSGSRSNNFISFGRRIVEIMRLVLNRPFLNDEGKLNSITVSTRINGRIGVAGGTKIYEIVKARGGPASR